VATIYYQTGMPDQLSKLSGRIARNYVRTLTRELSQNSARIALRPEIIREALSQGHRWLGEAMIAEGSRRDARKHLAESLMRSPWQPRTAALLGLSLLPDALDQAVKNAWRRMKSGFSA
jgi:hypothetical protein